MVFLPTTAKEDELQERICIYWKCKTYSCTSKNTFIQHLGDCCAQLLVMLSTLPDALGLADASLVSSTSLLRTESPLEKTKPLSNLRPNKCSPFVISTSLARTSRLAVDII